MTDNSKLGTLTRMLNDDRERNKQGQVFLVGDPPDGYMNRVLRLHKVYCSPGIVSIEKKSHTKPCHKTRPLESHGHTDWKGRHYL